MPTLYCDIQRRLKFFQYSIGDAKRIPVERYLKQHYRDFQYSIGDAADEVEPRPVGRQVVSFNTPLEMRDDAALRRRRARRVANGFQYSIGDAEPGGPILKLIPA